MTNIYFRFRHSVGTSYKMKLSQWPNGVNIDIKKINSENKEILVIALSMIIAGFYSKSPIKIPTLGIMLNTRRLSCSPIFHNLRSKYPLFIWWCIKSKRCLKTSNNKLSHCECLLSFPLICFFSVNMTISAVFCRFSHICWRNPQWKTSFFLVQLILDGTDFLTFACIIMKTCQTYFTILLCEHQWFLKYVWKIRIIN